MYRVLIATVTCVCVVTAAPQDSSEITYIKVQPLNVNPPTKQTLSIESKPEYPTISVIENNINTDGNESDSESMSKDHVYTPLQVDDKTVFKNDVSNESLGSNIENRPVKRYSVGNEAKLQLHDTHIEYETKSDNDTEDLTTPSDTFGSNEAIDTTEAATDRYDPSTEVYDTNKAKKAKFPSKLSYFQKHNNFAGSHATNLLERGVTRKFRSRCRCERIWNCPKLQITVPRCPEEYFLCCF